jgi:hypothetical protein
MTIAHTGIKTPASQHKAVVTWYTAALAPLGYIKAVDFLDGLVVGFLDTATQNVDWWVTSAAANPPTNPVAQAPEDVADRVPLPTHTAFAAKGELFCVSGFVFSLSLEGCISSCVLEELHPGKGKGGGVFGVVCHVRVRGTKGVEIGVDGE